MGSERTHHMVVADPAGERQEAEDGGLRGRHGGSTVWMTVSVWSQILRGYWSYWSFNEQSTSATPVGGERCA